ncbi:hypothetical protein K504DRAFT_462334 [Pleomassaria siparia CBS 279.74]|uniref:Uncharacterized protein n=1 Tax=Pleomassaria siparia CBS 279.74 TaxID=1314801 RepID=A0A6G1KMJ1_9PLEO|nr:hypothetical protein K504DRAFT_462334 [Pleomassaria siparia CBS 279.74]
MNRGNSTQKRKRGAELDVPNKRTKHSDALGTNPTDAVKPPAEHGDAEVMQSEKKQGLSDTEHAETDPPKETEDSALLGSSSATTVSDPATIVGDTHLATSSPVTGPSSSSSDEETPLINEAPNVALTKTEPPSVTTVEEVLPETQKEEEESSLSEEEDGITRAWAVAKEHLAPYAELGAPDEKKKKKKKKGDTPESRSEARSRRCELFRQIMDEENGLEDARLQRVIESVNMLHSSLIPLAERIESADAKITSKLQEARRRMRKLEDAFEERKKKKKKKKNNKFLPRNALRMLENTDIGSEELPSTLVKMESEFHGQKASLQILGKISNNYQSGKRAIVHLSNSNPERKRLLALGLEADVLQSTMDFLEFAPGGSEHRDLSTMLRLVCRILKYREPPLVGFSDARAGG